MRYSLVVELIRSHYEGASKRFEEIVNELANEEDKKGNSVVSKQLVKAINNSSKVENGISINNIESSNTATLTIFQKPKDRDSSLELFDWITPNRGLKDLILSTNTTETVNQILIENKNESLVRTFGLDATNRILLCGPPGCGKTSLANAIAFELNRPIAYVRLDSLISSYLGQTGTNIRAVFEAVQKTNAILFIDEFDAVAKKRDDSQELGELKRVVTTLLQNLDLLNRNVFVIAATNHEHLLDEAIWRRFDQIIKVNLPGEEQRVELLKRMLGHFPLGKINWGTLARGTNGFSCSLLEELTKQTAKRVLIHQKHPQIHTDDFIQTIVNYLMIEESVEQGVDEEILVKFVDSIQERGFSLRSISKAIGLPKSTLSDKIKEVKFNE